MKTLQATKPFFILMAATKMLNRPIFSESDSTFLHSQLQVEFVYSLWLFIEKLKSYHAYFQGTKVGDCKILIAIAVDRHFSSHLGQ